MSEKSEKLKKLLKLDEQARDICKPYGCRVVSCLKDHGNSQCGTLLAILNNCLDKTKRQLAPKYGLTQIK